MQGVGILGAQWGDEGKGRVVDFLTEKAPVVVRYQGGNNAGHTCVIGNQKIVLHLVPSGILRPGRLCLIGNGVVVNPQVLVEEIARLKSSGFLENEDRIRLSDRAHLIMPYHQRIDVLREERRGAAKIGTTGRGIGPAYEDKARRSGLRVGDLLDPEEFKKKLAVNLEENNAYIEKVLGGKGFTLGEILEPFLDFGSKIRGLIADTSRILDQEIKKGSRILFEGAQGSMLDLDHGTYPFVTSSVTTSGGIFSGSGLGYGRLSLLMVGVTKAYTTRVGAGPFPTELFDKTGDRLVEAGGEFGATTGRRRRTGWLDLVALNYASRLNGLGGLALTKIDVLSGLDPIRLAVAYRYKGERLTEFPADLKILSECQPEYEDLPGWREDLGAVRRISDLPPAVRRYLARVEELTGIPVLILSLGAERGQTVVIRDPFEV
ncbi:MAG: adenylosuccinate synthase [bacterium]|nr:adenylosuccinate synthase [bacterium]